MGASKEAINARLKAKSRAILTAATNAFNEKAAVIREEYKIRKKDLGAPPFSSAINYVKRECYTLIRKQLHRGSYQEITILSDYRNRKSVQSDFGENPFYWRLLAIDPDFSLIDKRNLSLYAKELMYAHRHKVPPEYLVGFIYQSGTQKQIKKRFDSGAVEDEFLLVRNRAR